MARPSFIACTSKDHEGKLIHVNLDRVDLAYEDEDGGTILVMAGWASDDVLHIVETPTEFFNKVYTSAR